MPTIQLQRGPGGAGPGCLLFAPGLTLAAIGLAILLFPELLGILVGGLLLGVGALLLGAAWQMSRGGPRGGFSIFTNRLRR